MPPTYERSQENLSTLPLWMILGALLTATSIVAVDTPASANGLPACPSTEEARITLPVSQSSGGLGRVVAASDDWLVSFGGVGLQFFRRVEEAWTHVQSIDVSISGNFLGNCLAIDGDLVVAGSPFENFYQGAAYVYRLNGTQWSFEQRLALGQPDGPQFGTSVAVQDGQIVIGAMRHLISGSPLQRGVAHVYLNDGVQWNLHQTLAPPSNLAWFDFGASVTIDGDLIAVGMPFSGVDGSGNPITNAVFVYRNLAGVWTYEHRIVPPDGNLNGGFAHRLVLDDGWLLVTSPTYDVAGSNDEGRALVFPEAGGAWTPAQILLPPVDDGACCDRFGLGADLRGDALVIGSPYTDVAYPQDRDPMENAGLAHVYRLISGQWTLDRELRQRWRQMGNYASVHADVEWDFLGAAVAISHEQILVGAPYGNHVNGNDQGLVLAYPFTAPDCDANGTPDQCEPIDCNHNAAADVCELLAASSTDCDGNNVPDECDAEFTYVLDDGNSYSAWGYIHVDFDMLWLNTFRVKPGGQWISHAAMSWTRYAPDLLPGRALIYSDPNQDGNPSDAQLLTQFPIQSRNDFGWTWPIPFTTYALPPTFVGEPGTTYFLGFILSSPADTYPATFVGIDGLVRGWLLATPAGQLDPANPQASGYLFQPRPTFAVRGIGLDCNHNGTPDACDITAGSSPDANLNGIPDECEPACPADASPPGGNGEVNVDDLLAVINDWGPCLRACRGDVTFDDAVTLDDLLLVINAWGPCGK